MAQRRERGARRECGPLSRVVRDGPQGGPETGAESNARRTEEDAAQSVVEEVRTKAPVSLEERGST